MKEEGSSALPPPSCGTFPLLRRVPEPGRDLAVAGRDELEDALELHVEAMAVRSPQVMSEEDDNGV